MQHTAAVITISDKGARGERQDTSGPALCAIAMEYDFEVIYTAIIPDEDRDIRRELIRCADELGVSLVLTTGGTGFSPRDVTPEATKAVIERETPGIPEAMRAASMRITPRGCLSRCAAGIRGRVHACPVPAAGEGVFKLHIGRVVVFSAVHIGVDDGTGGPDFIIFGGRDAGSDRLEDHDVVENLFRIIQGDIESAVQQTVPGNIFECQLVAFSRLYAGDGPLLRESRPRHFQHALEFPVQRRLFPSVRQEKQVPAGISGR